MGGESWPQATFSSKATGDGGDDGHPIPRLQGSGLLLQRTHVLVVHEDTDVAPQRARRVDEPVADAPPVSVRMGPGIWTRMGICLNPSLLSQGGHSHMITMGVRGPP